MEESYLEDIAGTQGENLVFEGSRTGWCSLRLKQVLSTVDQNPAFTRIDLRHNRLNDSCAEVIADFLKTNTTIVSLNLADNQISINGISKIAQALKTNHSLQVINLKENDLGIRSLQVLQQALEFNETLIDLEYLPPTHLATDKILLPLQLKIAEQLERNQNLKKINTELPLYFQKIRLLFADMICTGKVKPVRQQALQYHQYILKYWQYINNHDKAEWLTLIAAKYQLLDCPRRNQALDILLTLGQSEPILNKYVGIAIRARGGYGIETSLPAYSSRVTPS